SDRHSKPAGYARCARFGRSPIAVFKAMRNDGMSAPDMRVRVRLSSPDQSLTLPELRPTFGRKLLDRERGSARHCGLNLLAHLSLGRSGTPLRGGGVLFRHAASLSGMSQLTACAISTSPRDSLWLR